MRVIPLFGAGTYGKSAVVTRQRRLNVYFENRKDGDKAKVVVYGTPAMVPVFNLTSPNGVAPRAFVGDANNLYSVASNVFQVNSPITGAELSAATLSTFVGNASIALSPSQAVVVDGKAGYSYTIANYLFNPISNFPATGAQTATFCSGFFVAEQPGTQKFWVSNAFDATTWGSLAFASASQGTGPILAVDQLNGILIPFATDHMEFWQNQGLTPQPFAPILSAANEWGLAAAYSRAHIDQSIIFLGITKQGQVQLCKLTGFEVQVISGPDEEYIWSTFSTVADAVALTYQIDHHPMYQISFPTANRSWIFDQSTGISSEVQSGVSPNPTRHNGQLSAVAGGRNLITTTVGNQIFQMQPATYTEASQIRREIVTRHVLSNFNRIKINQVYLDFETGVGLETGQGSNPVVMLQSSKDNGRTWSTERFVSIGQVGQYRARAVWRRFGTARDFVFRIVMTDPVKFVITDGAVVLSERQGAAQAA